MAENQSRFVWYELMTTDAEAAKAFYTEVVGWTTKAWSGAVEYTLLEAGDEAVAGLMAIPGEARARGVEPHWLGYLGVPRVDAAAEQVEDLGGHIYVPPQDIPEVGRFAVAADPQGAVFALFTPKEIVPPSEREPRLGTTVWHELNTTDHESAWTFYAQLFGWRHTESIDMGPELGTYWIFESGGPGASMGGMSNAARTEEVPPHWLYYVHVGDIDAAARRVRAQGGTILNGPMEVPGGDWILQARDPQGAVFALHGART